MDHAEMLNGLLDEKLREISEYFDAVQILGTFVDDDGDTIRVTRGFGNWYARQGVAREFLDMEAAQTTAYEIAKVLPGSNEEDD
jgi:hypothetical protein